MEHLIVLFNLLTLLAGLGVVGGLVRTWTRRRDVLSFWQLFHFAGFTFTMVVAALDAYSVVNLVANETMIRFWSSLVLVGTALMAFSFPHLARAQVRRRLTPRFRVFWAALALVPVGAAGVVLVVPDYTWALSVIFVSFLPFWASVVYGLSVGTRPGARGRSQAWVAFVLLGLVAAVEVAWIVAYPPASGYFFVTLPLAYLYTSWTSWRSATVPPAGLSLPAPLAEQNALTPREREVAEGILRGLANKELAHELGLSDKTVRNHIFNLYRKLGIQKRLDLVLLVQKYQEPSGPTGTIFPSSEGS